MTERQARAELNASLDIALKMGMQVVNDEIMGTAAQFKEHQHRLDCWRNTHEHYNQNHRKSGNGL